MAVQSCSCLLPVSCSPLPPLNIFLLFCSSLSSFAFLPPIFPLLFLSYFLYLYVSVFFSLLTFFLLLSFNVCFMDPKRASFSDYFCVSVYMQSQIQFSFSVFQPCLPSPHTQITETFPLPVTSSVPLFFTLC